MIVLAAAFVLAAAAAPTPPPTIIRERVSPVCSTLHQLEVPFAQMNVKNKPIMQAIHALQTKLAKARNSRLGDGVFLYASQMDMLYTGILQNLTDVDRQLRKSYAAYPQGTNAKVDALCQRVQNVVDLLRVMDNEHLAATAAVVDNDAVTGIESSLDRLVGERQDVRGPPPPLPSDIVPFSTSGPGPDVPVGLAPPVAADNDPKLASSSPPGFAMRSLKWSRPAELQDLMQREGPALEAQALIAAHDCDGA